MEEGKAQQGAQVQQVTLEFGAFQICFDFLLENLEGNVLDMELSHLDGVDGKNEVGFLLLGKFGGLKTLDGGFSEISGAVFESFVHLVQVAEVLPSFGLAFELEGLVDLVQVGEIGRELFSLLGPFVELLEVSARLLRHDRVVTLEGGDWGEIIDQVWKS